VLAADTTRAAGTNDSNTMVAAAVTTASARPGQAMHPERRQETLAVANVDQPLTHPRGNTTAGTRITTTTIVPTAVNTGPTSITRAAVRTWYGSEPPSQVTELQKQR
jgi:hypothetical protein